MKRFARTIILVLFACTTVLYAQNTSGSNGSANALSKKNGMVLVEGGTFNMGSNNGEENEKPVHSVSVSSFYICNHEVTQSEFEAIIRLTK